MISIRFFVTLAALVLLQHAAWAQPPSNAQAVNVPNPAGATSPQTQAPVTPVAPVTPAGGSAQSTHVPLITPATTLAPLATQLGQTIQTLVGVPPAPSPTASDEDNAGQVTDTFATATLNAFLRTVDTLKKNNSAFDTNATAWPDFSDWLQRQSTDPRRVLLWQNIGNDLVVIIGAPLLGSLAIFFLLLPVLFHLRRRMPESLGGKLALILSIFGLRMIAAVVFLGASLLLLDQNEQHFLPRFVILNIIYAITLAYSVRRVLRAIFAPNAEHLRVLSFTTAQAVYACRWFSAYAILIIYGYFFIDVATALRIPASTITLFQNLLALTLTVMTVAVIMQTRYRVAALLRGKPRSAENPYALIFSVRARLARHWHKLAIIYLVVGLVVTVLDIENGFALMLRGTFLTLVILALLRLCFLAIDMWILPSTSSSALIHRQILSFLIRPMLWVVAGAAIAAIWGLHVGDVIALPFGQRASNAFIGIGLTLAILTLLYEGLNSLIDRHLNPRERSDKTPMASARARTLLPMMRGSVFILFSAITILTILSSVGINVGPLLAGAGVLGVAVGFGSQTLVKDFLNGLFIVAENTVVVGDVVKIGTFGGVVETLSIRTIRLRDQDGALHIIPFSEVTMITNMTRGFAFAVVDIAVANNSDLERVMQVMRDVGAKLQADPVFKQVILEPIEVMGVETLGDSSITLRARMRTRPGKQWDVRRLLLLRIKQRFDQESIDIPFPTVTHITKVVTDTTAK